MGDIMVPVCPDCGKPLDRVYKGRSVEFELDQSGTSPLWIEKNVYLDSVSCPHCQCDLEESLFDDAGMPLPTAI